MIVYVSYLFETKYFIIKNSYKLSKISVRFYVAGYDS